VLILFIRAAEDVAFLAAWSCELELDYQLGSHPASILASVYKGQTLILDRQP